jgi:hypothetical protein
MSDSEWLVLKYGPKKTLQGQGTSTLYGITEGMEGTGPGKPGGQDLPVQGTKDCFLQQALCRRFPFTKDALFQKDPEHLPGGSSTCLHPGLMAHRHHPSPLLNGL